MTIRTLMDRAREDLQNIKLILASVDDNMYDLAGYHLQQFVEKGLKQYLINKRDYNKYGHQLDTLYDAAINKGLSENKEFKRILKEVTEWEAKTRYSGNQLVYRARLLEFIEICVKEIDNILKTEYYDLLYPGKIVDEFSAKEIRLTEWVKKEVRKIPSASKEGYGDTNILIATNAFRSQMGLKMLEDETRAREYLYAILEL